ncbi:Hypothetical protein PHPALM_14192 [Phytophthora palmivora]|uniref:Uncharacterized protein n=1 Tax=Phytophthora palmivora TaxID=4796 RepID=A0A2P4XVD9_9STRA|nr:Hypothetical protein PHPALM_14192 [Phytophthora palmivora]
MYARNQQEYNDAKGCFHNQQAYSSKGGAAGDVSRRKATALPMACRYLVEEISAVKENEKPVMVY